MLNPPTKSTTFSFVTRDNHRNNSFMKIRRLLFFKIVFIFCCLDSAVLWAQQPLPSHILFQKGKTPLEGMWTSTNEKTIVFTDVNGLKKTYQRSTIDSIVRIQPINTEKTKVDLVAIRLAYPKLDMAENLDIHGMEQEHILQTVWGQKYKGTITEITVEKLVLSTPNGANLPFLMKEITVIETLKSKENTITSYKKRPAPNPKVIAKKKQRLRSDKEAELSKNISIPTRIGIVPTAFNLQPGQCLYRNSATYLNEFLIAGKYFNVAIGDRLFQPFLKIQATIPIKKYLHVSLLGEINMRLGIFNDLLSEGRLAVSPIVTIGTPDYFLNLSYKTKAPLFLPINDQSDYSPIRDASYWSFGGGVKLSKRIQFLTENMLIGNRKDQRHYRVFFGLTFQLKNHTFGAGLTVFDADDEENTFISTFNLNGVAPSLQYTIRFK